MRIVVPHDLHRTVRPRATSGIASTLRHVKFGHMILTIFWSDIGNLRLIIIHRQICRPIRLIIANSELRDERLCRLSDLSAMA